MFSRSSESLPYPTNQSLNFDFHKQINKLYYNKRNILKALALAINIFKIGGFFL